MRVLGYVISDSGRYSKFGYPDIRIPVEITNLFATHLNHKVLLYVSLFPDQHVWDIDALNINWSGLTIYAYTPTGLLQGDPKNQAKQLPHCNSPRLARDALVLGPREIPLQLPVSTTLLKQSRNQVFHNNPQYLDLHAWLMGPRTTLLCGSGMVNCCPLKVINKDHL